MTQRLNSETFNPVDSERALRVAKLAAHAEDVFRSHTNATAWLNRPNRSLGGVTPLSLCETEIGRDAADETLTRIAHGIFS